MSPEIETRVLQSWDAISAWAQKGGEFVAEQAPLVAWEIVAYGRVFHTAALIACLGAIATCIVVVCRAPKLCKNDFDKLSAFGMSALIALFPCLFAGAGAYYNAAHAMKAWFAPRLYVLEYVADLVGVLA